MPLDRTQLRGTLLVEDRRTERFFRNLLVHLGFDKRKFNFRIAPSGRGDASVWVRSQYPAEVNLVRRKRHQRLCLITVRDGDRFGVTLRKIDLDTALSDSGFDRRQARERIATPVPTWSIETWLLFLLGDDALDERVTRKHEFEQGYSSEEGRTLRDAARAWRYRATGVPSMQSLTDGYEELGRIDSA